MPSMGMTAGESSVSVGPATPIVLNVVVEFDPWTFQAAFDVEIFPTAE